MEKVVSATEARIHFGGIIRQAQIAPVIVERDGELVVVILSKRDYDRMLNPYNDWKAMLSETHRIIRETPEGKELPDPVEMIREAREIRDEQIADSLR